MTTYHMYVYNVVQWLPVVSKIPGSTLGWNGFLLFFLIRSIIITLIIFLVGGAWVWLFWVYAHTMGWFLGNFFGLLCWLLDLKTNYYVEITSKTIQTQLQNMLWTWLKNWQSIKKLRFTRSRISKFTFIIKLWTKLFLSKHKNHNYTTDQMVCWLSLVPSTLSIQVQIQPSRLFSFNLFSQQTYARKVCLHVSDHF